MVEQFILPMVQNYVDLKVLSYKLRASFYHIFVLFHNNPPINSRIVRSRSGSVGSIGGTYGLFPDPLSPKVATTRSASSREPIRSPSKRQRSPAISLGVPVGGSTTTRTPPGLSLPTPFSTNPYTSIENGPSSRDSSIATFLLPLIDYTPHATAAFNDASKLADTLLPGSHPVRLSVKVEYVAYVYDCLKETEVSRRMARMAIRNVYGAKEGMDDESFEDAAEMVGMLGRMMRRGLGGSNSNSQGGSTSATNIGGGISGNGTGNVNTHMSTPSLRGGGGNMNGHGHVRRRTGGSDSTTEQSQQPSTWV